MSTTPATNTDRMPPLPREAMDEHQRAAADELIAGPRKAVLGPFIALLRSPELMARLQRVGEFLRWSSTLPPRAREYATLFVARRCTQDFEWAVHVPLARAEGTSEAAIAALREGARPAELAPDEALVHDFATELLQQHGVCDPTYAAARERFGEAGVVELVSLLGYFTLVSWVLNVAHTPAGASTVAPLPALPR